MYAQSKPDDCDDDWTDITDTESTTTLLGPEPTWSPKTKSQPETETERPFDALRTPIPVPVATPIASQVLPTEMEEDIASSMVHVSCRLYEAMEVTKFACNKLIHEWSGLESDAASSAAHAALLFSKCNGKKVDVFLGAMPREAVILQTLSTTQELRMAAIGAIAGLFVEGRGPGVEKGQLLPLSALKDTATRETFSRYTKDTTSKTDLTVLKEAMDDIKTKTAPKVPDFIQQHDDETALSLARLLDLTFRKDTLQFCHASTKSRIEGAATATDKTVVLDAQKALSTVVQETYSAVEFMTKLMNAAIGLAKQVPKKKCENWEVGATARGTNNCRPRHAAQEKSRLKHEFKKVARAMIGRRSAAVDGRGSTEMDLGSMALDDMDVDNLLQRWAHPSPYRAAWWAERGPKMFGKPKTLLPDNLGALLELNEVPDDVYGLDELDGLLKQAQAATQQAVTVAWTIEARVIRSTILGVRRR